MEDKISIDFPVNLNSNDKNIFLNLKDYVPHLCEVFRFSNVFITRSGICLKNLKIVDASIPSYQGKRKYFYKVAIFNYFFRRKIYLKNENKYLLIHNPWCPGYYHWITEALPRLWSVRNTLENLIILLPSSFKTYPLDSLAPFKVKDIIWIPEKKNIKVDCLIIPSNTTYTGKYDPRVINEIRSHFFKYLTENKRDNLNLGEKIYVSRGKAKVRKIQNERDLIEVLKLENFSIIYFEDYTFWEQVSIMYHAKFFISIHGAGLTNLMFMRDGGRILELQKANTNEMDFYSPLYWHLACVCKHHYLYQFVPPVHKGESIYRSDVVVDINLFNENLSLMLK